MGIAFEGNLKKAKELLVPICDSKYWSGCNFLGIVENQMGNLIDAKKHYAVACKHNDMFGCFSFG
ncbi:MAG: hypothetical protein H7336_05350 [Bacteriovorax sp.]|nr:hypothetical protein [Bacteriovorax sp.]